jgi:hypothetical protein
VIPYLRPSGRILVFDGMIAVSGRVVLSVMDGRLLCLRQTD